MARITEDYISFETAKLLIKKGFDYNSEYYSYYTFGGVILYFADRPQDLNIAPRVTLQMAMRWLREIHDFNVNVELTIHGYSSSLSHIVRGSLNDIIDIEDLEAWETAYYDSYEEACEVAIKYCLENLI